MKLGEALNERARLAKRVAELRDVLEGCIVVQEGEEPPADPDAITDEVMTTIDQIEALIAAINHTNSITKLPDGTVLTDALAYRDALGAKIAHLEFIIRKLSGKDQGAIYRRMASELREERLVNLKDVREQRDAFAQKRRTLEAALQTVNWTVDLIE